MQMILMYALHVWKRVFYPFKFILSHLWSSNGFFGFSYLMQLKFRKIRRIKNDLIVILLHSYMDNINLPMQERYVIKKMTQMELSLSKVLPPTFKNFRWKLEIANEHKISSSHNHHRLVILLTITL